MAGEYIYKNEDDTKRFKIWKRVSNYWDVDIWDNPHTVTIFSSEAAEVFNSKAEAKDWIEENYGEIKSLGKIPTVCHKWSTYLLPSEYDIF